MGLLWFTKRVDFPEEELGSIILKYGEERSWRKIAKAIASARAIEPIQTTHHLAEIIAEATGRPLGQGGVTHPAVRT